MFELSPKTSKAAGEGSAEDQIARIVNRHDGARGSLIATLEDIQSVYGYLPEKSLRLLAEKTGKSLVDVYGVATFYNQFDLKPRGEHLVSVCLGTACHVRNSGAVVEEFKSQLGIEVGQTTADRRFTLKTVNCLGACALGPVAVIDGRYFSKLNRLSVGSLIEKTTEGHCGRAVKDDERVFPVEAICPACNQSLMDEGFLMEEIPAIKVSASFGDSQGWLRLSSLYGRHDMLCEHDVPLETVVNYSCPHCQADLAGAWRCTRCEAPMAQLGIRGGGTLRVCPRSGCCGPESRMLDLA